MKAEIICVPHPLMNAGWFVVTYNTLLWRLMDILALQFGKRAPV